uniref:Uncharacterized protein n=1 Tax=Acrobeloides nanus TaxID=290746 RepID=A0A914CEZ6_9BILA
MQSKDNLRLSLTYSHGDDFIDSIQNNSKVMVLEIDSEQTDPDFFKEDSFYGALNSANNLFFVDVNMGETAFTSQIESIILENLSDCSQNSLIMQCRSKSMTKVFVKDNKKGSIDLLDLCDDVLQVNKKEFNKLLCNEFGVSLLIKGIKSNIAGEFLNEPSLSIEAFKKRVETWFSELDKIDEISVILKVLAQYPILEEIIFDEERSSIIGADVYGSHLELGVTDFEKRRICMGTKQQESGEFLGILAHELTHLAMHQVYKNNRKPYEEDSDDGLFYLAIIFIIFIGTLFTALILNIHLQKAHHKAVPTLIGFLFFHKIAPWLSIQPPTTLLELWLDTGVTIKGINKLKGDKKRKAIYQSMRRANNDDKVKEKILKEIEKNNKNHRLLTSDPIPTFNHINPPELSYSHSLTSNMSARAPAQPYQLSFPPSHRGSVISNLNPPAAPLSPLTLDVGGIGLIRRNTPTRAARARQNWQRLAQKAYRTAKEDRARRLQEIPYVDAPPPSTFTTMPIRLQMLCLQNSPLFKNSPGPTSAEASAMHLKLKRRYGQEWEYLATVLDRLLLIVFSFLVILVTGAVILIGEGIHLSYKMQEDNMNSENNV